MKYAFKIFVLIFIVCSHTNAQIPAKTIPDFEFYTLNRTSFTNKNVQTGKLSFFIFFDANCEHCQHAMQDLNKHKNELKNVALYLVSLDDANTINKFMAINAPNLKDNKNVTVLQDAKYQFIQQFKPTKYPSLFLYSPQKKLIRYECDERYMDNFLEDIKKR